tara:strand:+ start:269 stop:550 length:282 start_codon:yes stop_codon:yes gene_type:complete
LEVLVEMVEVVVAVEAVVIAVNSVVLFLFVVLLFLLPVILLLSLAILMGCEELSDRRLFAFLEGGPDKSLQLMLVWNVIVEVDVDTVCGLWKK